MLRFGVDVFRIGNGAAAVLRSQVEYLAGKSGVVSSVSGRYEKLTKARDEGSDVLRKAAGSFSGAAERFRNEGAEFGQAVENNLKAAYVDLKRSSEKGAEILEDSLRVVSNTTETVQREGLKRATEFGRSIEKDLAAGYHELSKSNEKGEKTLKESLRTVAKTADKIEKDATAGYKELEKSAAQGAKVAKDSLHTLSNTVEKVQRHGSESIAEFGASVDKNVHAGSQALRESSDQARKLVEDTLQPQSQKSSKMHAEGIEKHLDMKKPVEAPVKEGQKKSYSTAVARDFTASPEPLLRSGVELKHSLDAENSPSRTESNTGHATRRVASAASVPASSISRAVGFGTLGVRLAAGAASEMTKRLFRGSENLPSGGVILTEANANRIASSLSRMRGAALKLGQMISIQDQNLLPKELVRALETVRQNADYMPMSQLNKVMTSELGENWRDKFGEFNETPIAAASIGQVHKGKTLDGVDVAVKVQYPGVAESIGSDINNLKRLVTYSGAVKKSYYLDEALAYAREELAKECEYEEEARNQNHFRELLMHDERFYVPRALTELSSRKVLTSEWLDGKPIDTFGPSSGYSQEGRDSLGSLLMELTLKELFELRFMQTDPNFSNFFFDGKILSLLDFGAARGYSKGFVDNYLRMVYACAERDREGVLHYSQKLGFLTGDESKNMLEAHVQASFTVGEPFQSDEPYNFKEKQVAGRTARYGHELAHNRLTPPPVEAYSLHRRLSGAFLMCVRLEASVRGRSLLQRIYDQYEFGQETSKNDQQEAV